MLVSLLIALVTPFLVLFMIWQLEIYAVTRMRPLLVAVLWGMLAFALAYMIQTALYRTGIYSFKEIALLNAPILEECLKLIPLAWLAWRMKLRYAADGAAYGFAIGTGFAVAENVLYISLNPESALAVSASRIVSTNFMHMFTAAWVGSMAGKNVYKAGRQRVVLFVATALFALGVHMAFNMLTASLQGVPLLLVSTGIGFAGMFVILRQIDQEVRKAGQTIQATLNNTMSAGEMAAVVHPDDVVQIAGKHQQVLGKRRYKLILKYIRLVARRGLLRNLQTVNQRPRFKETLNREITLIDQQITELREGMGAYSWLWFRSMLPSEDSDLWAKLQAEVAQEQPTLELLKQLQERKDAITPEEFAARQDLLRSVPLFRQLSDNDLLEVALMLQEDIQAADTVVIAEGSRSDYLYIVQSGVLIMQNPQAGSHDGGLIRYIPGSIFGEMSLLDRAPYPANVIATTDVKLYRLARADFIALIYARPDMGVEMLREIAGTLRQQIARRRRWGRRVA